MWRMLIGFLILFQNCQAENILKLVNAPLVTITDLKNNINGSASVGFCTSCTSAIVLIQPQVAFYSSIHAVANPGDKIQLIGASGSDLSTYTVQSCVSIFPFNVITITTPAKQLATPSKLPSSASPPPEGTLCTVFGFGTGDGNPMALNHLETKIISFADCKAAYGSSLDSSLNFCAYVETPSNISAIYSVADFPMPIFCEDWSIQRREKRCFKLAGNSTKWWTWWCEEDDYIEKNYVVSGFSVTATAFPDPNPYPILFLYSGPQYVPQAIV